jgi:autotransporter-associated beta strand protein/T5SS/PEP-CTERM-associated repeat protein
LAVLGLVAVQPVQAATITWGVAGDGNWDIATANWLPGPTTFTDGTVDDVIFDDTAGGTITISANMSPLSTTVSAASGTYTFSGGPIDSGSLTKSGAGTLVLSGANTYTGETKVNGGTLKLVAGLSAVANRVVTVDSGTLNNNGGDYNVGNGVAGNLLTIKNGGLGTSINNLYIGLGSNSANNNKVTVTGGTSILNANSTIHVGNQGQYNTLEVKNGAYVSSPSGLYVGEAGATYNSVLIDGLGSQLIVGSGGNPIRFGYGDNNTMTVSNGGYLASYWQFNIGGSATYGVGNGNTLTITDPGSEVYCYGPMMLGRRGLNNLILVQNGGYLNIGNAFTCGEKGGSGTVTVTGAGSRWVMNGGANSPGLSNCTVNVYSGGFVNVASIGGTTFNLGDGNLGAGGVFSKVTANNLATSFLNFNKGVLVAKQDNAALITGIVTLTGPAYIDTATYTDTIAVAMGGIGSLTKQGTGTLTLSSLLNTYTGDTTVSGGTLEVAQAFFDDDSTVYIASGALLNLNTLGATDTILYLYLGGELQKTGFYDATNTPTYLSGTGSLYVILPEPATMALLGLGSLGLILSRKRK